MKRTNHSCHQSAWIQTCLAALGMSAATSAMAQSVLITPPTMPESQPGTSQPTSSAREPGNEASSDGGTPGSVNQPLQWRKLTFHPRVSYQFMYGNGILSQTNRAQKTIVQTISPGMSVDIGTHWSASYTPSIVIYSDKSFKDALNHAVTLSGHTSYDDWNYGVGASAGISSSPLTETAKQTDQKSYSGSVNASRQLNGKLSLNLSGGAGVSEASGLNSSRNYTASEGLNYQLASGIGTGISLTEGYENTSQNGDSIYEQLQARIAWQIIDRVNFSLSGGPEIRQFLNSDKSSMVSGIFSGSLSYQPLDATTLSVNANRSVGSSLLQNQLTETTSISASISQRFFRRYFAALSGGYTFTDYQSSRSNSSSGRSDTTRFISANIGTAIMKRGHASVFYSKSENLTNKTGYGYSSNQVGFSLSYSY